MTVNPRQSFKLKLCLSILGLSLLIFFFIFSAAFTYTSREMRSSVETIVTSKLVTASRAIDDRLHNLVVASDNFLSVVASPHIKFSQSSSAAIGKAYLDANPHVQGICIGYEDGSRYNHPGPWCPYVMRMDGDYVARDLSQTKDFRNSEWYKTAHDSGEPSWSNPFVESNGTLIVSYNVPLTDESGNVRCVVAVDQNIMELSDSLQKLRPYEGSNLYLVDKEGRFIAHPDHDSVYVAKASGQLLEFIASSENYMVNKLKGDDIFVFKSMVETTGWTVLLSIPRSSMTVRVAKMMKVMLLDMLVGILLLLIVSYVVIDRLTKPLEVFADAAKKIAHGDFKVDIPVIRDHNELYDLRAALASMEVSLDNYMNQLEETSSKKASIEKELDIARNIQMAMIPKIFPPYPDRDNLDIFASLTPAQAVGGDLYDFVLLGDKFFFCIGDVSGKGVPASLFMAITRTLFRNTVTENLTPAQIATQLNNAISDGNDMGMFVTMIIASYDLVSGELRICNCGHNLPATNGVIVDPKSMVAAPGPESHLISVLPANIAVGVFPDFEFKEVMMHITPGCSLLLYTDGVTEADNENSELYDESRMLAFLQSKGADASSREIVEGLVADVKAFSGNAVQSDDITVLCLRCNRLG